jgi:nucleotide exchange factor SIL1
MTSFIAENKIFRILLYFGILLVLHDGANWSLLSDAKEIEPTKEWQLVEGNDTIPAGMHVRMDMTTGEKWVKVMSKDGEEAGDEDSNKEFKDVHFNTNEIDKKSVSVAIVETGGDVRIEQNDNDITKNSRKSTTFDFEMMHRTLSKLPPEEIEAMGGLPELSDSNNSPSRIAFEKHMLEIWKKRQAELLELELNFPDILKARIAGIEDYIKNPRMQLESVNLDADSDDTDVTDIVSLLKDLEFQLSDIDMARDFHTMNGWVFLVKLLFEDTHVPVNKTIHDLSQSIKTKIRTIQSYAAWAIGTAVKNTEEFFPYGVESVVLDNMKTSSAIDLLIDIFCDQYDEPSSWETRTLLAKGIYAIGAILRGNQLAQTYVVNIDGFNRLGKKFRELSQQGFNSANTKLIQRMATFSMDIVEDISLRIDLSNSKANTEIIHSISSTFCDATCELFTSETFVPVPVQETLMKAITVMGTYCQESNCSVSSVRLIVDAIQLDWSRNKNSFDADHFQDLQDMARVALDSLGVQMDKDE